MIEQSFALLGRGERRIAGRTARMQVLRLPGKGRRPVRGKPAIARFHLDTAGTEISNRLKADMLGKSRQHDRGLDGAAVNAVAQFFRRKQSIRSTEARPR